MSTINDNDLKSVYELPIEKLTNFNSVWEDILKIKIEILSKIGEEQGVGLKELINEFLPVAYDYKHLWEDTYIINDISNITSDNNTILDVNDNLNTEESISNIKKNLSINDDLNSNKESSTIENIDNKDNLIIKTKKKIIIKEKKSDKKDIDSKNISKKKTQIKIISCDK